MGLEFERTQSSTVMRTPDSFTEFSSPVKLDGSEGVGGPCGTSRSWGDLLVHTNTPKDPRSPIDDQPWNPLDQTTNCLTNERPTRHVLRLETTYFDEIGSYPELFERCNVRICIDVVTEGILARQ